MAGPYTKPTVNASTGVWGTLLNTIVDDVTADITATEGVADAALPKTGGTMTGAIVATTQTWAHSDEGNISGATPLDIATAHSFNGVVVGATTISFANVPAGAVFVTFEIVNGGSAAITWPAAVLWAGGSEPGWTAAGTDIATFYTRNAGTTWYGALALEDCS